MPEDLPQPSQNLSRADRGPNPRLAFCWSVWILSLCVSLAGWHFLDLQLRAGSTRDREILRLFEEGSLHLANRRWNEASECYDQIELKLPESPLAAMGRQRIAKGKQEEETQFLAYWVGQGQAELDAGRLDEAQEALDQILKRHPGHPEASRMRDSISGARIEREIQSGIATIHELAGRGDWEAACDQARILSGKHPNHPDLAKALQLASEAKARHLENLRRADQLYQQALDLDTGSFNREALELLREAALLAPGHPEIASLLEKISSRSRTLRVPEDYTTPMLALNEARANDRIVIGAGIWQGPLSIRIPVKIEGQGMGQTIISCPAEDGNALTSFSDDVEIDGISFQHQTLHYGPGKRHSAAVVASGRAVFRNCEFHRSSGHGLAVIRGAKAKTLHCRFSENSWNGASASDPNSSIHMEDCASSGNFQNGVEAWHEAKASVLRSTITGNTRNGIHADRTASVLDCRDNTIHRNREFGIFLGSPAQGTIERNRIQNNLLGGILVRRMAAKAMVRDNLATDNAGPDLILEQGLNADAYTTNQLTGQRKDAIKTAVAIDP